MGCEGESLSELRRQGSQVSMRVARGSASWLSSHGRVIGPQDGLKKAVTQATKHEPGFVLRQSGSRTFFPLSKPVYLVSSTLRPASSACKAGTDPLQPGYLDSELPLVMQSITFL